MMSPCFKAIHPARVAQGIEHRIPNPGVARSIRAVGTNGIKGCQPDVSNISLAFFSAIIIITKKSAP